MTKLVIGYPHGDETLDCFNQSLLNTLNECQDIIRAVQAVSAGAYSLDRARNGIVDKFLGTDAEWLLQIDTDMSWKPEDVRALLRTADPRHRPVVGALCFRTEGLNDLVGPVLMPTLYRFGEDGKHAPVLEYKGVERVDITGGAFLLAHRSVFTTIGSGWFSHHPDQETSSEDWAFCLRLREHGIPLHVDTRVKIGHYKRVMLTEVMYHNMLRRLNELEATGWKAESA